MLQPQIPPHIFMNLDWCSHAILFSWTQFIRMTCSDWSQTAGHSTRPPLMAPDSLSLSSLSLMKPSGDPQWAGSWGLAAKPGQNRYLVVCHPLTAGGHVLERLVVVTGEEVIWLKTSSSSACELLSWLLCHLWMFCTQVWSVYRNSGALLRSKVVTPTLPSEFKNSINYAVVCFLSANSWVINHHWPLHPG